jgi:hypothetical protein
MNEAKDDLARAQLGRPSSSPPRPTGPTSSASPASPDPPPVSSAVHDALIELAMLRTQSPMAGESERAPGSPSTRPLPTFSALSPAPSSPPNAFSTPMQSEGPRDYGPQIVDYHGEHSWASSDLEVSLNLDWTSESEATQSEATTDVTSQSDNSETNPRSSPVEM